MSPWLGTTGASSTTQLVWPPLTGLSAAGRSSSVGQKDPCAFYRMSMLASGPDCPPSDVVHARGSAAHRDQSASRVQCFSRGVQVLTKFAPVPGGPQA